MPKLIIVHSTKHHEFWYYFGLFMYLLMFGIVVWNVWDYMSSNKDYDKYIVPGTKAYDTGDYSTALHDYNQYKRFHPGDPNVHAEIADVLMKQGHYIDARAELIEAIDDSDPKIDTSDWKAEIEKIDKSQ